MLVLVLVQKEAAFQAAAQPAEVHLQMNIFCVTCEQTGTQQSSRWAAKGPTSRESELVPLHSQQGTGLTTDVTQPGPPARRSPCPGPG